MSFTRRDVLKSATLLIVALLAGPSLAPAMAAEDEIRRCVFANGRALLRWTDAGRPRERWMGAAPAAAIWDALFASDEEATA